MKSIEYRKYGSPDVLKLVGARKPSIKDNEVLVKVYVSFVNPSDLVFRSGEA